MQISFVKITALICKRMQFENIQSMLTIQNSHLCLQINKKLYEYALITTERQMNNPLRKKVITVRWPLERCPSVIFCNSVSDSIRFRCRALSLTLTVETLASSSDVAGPEFWNCGSASLYVKSKATYVTLE